MADSHADAPEQDRPSVSPSVPPDSVAPPSRDFSGEDFLFHLYRGSELLQDNCINEAKEELERALAFQPRDAEGQALLGVVYFRLGLYPRAIRIYEEIVKTYPDERTPRMNLALCYLKTGQSIQAREMLEAVIQREPGNRRAWSYLGLIFERLGDHSKALAAFQKAGQRNMARRMEHLLGNTDWSAPDSEFPHREQVRAAVSDAADELDQHAEPPFQGISGDTEASPSRSGRWRAVELGEQQLPAAARVPRDAGLSSGPALSYPSLHSGRTSIPPAVPSAVPLGAWASERQLTFPAAGSMLSAEHSILVSVAGRAFVRGDALSLMLPEDEPFSSAPAKRRRRGQLTDEPLGSAGRILLDLQGRGQVALRPSPGETAHLVMLGEDSLYVRESALLSFDHLLQYECGLLHVGGGGEVAMVQLSGSGSMAFTTTGRIASVRIGGGPAVTMRVRDVLGWTGRLLSRALPQDQSPEHAPGFATVSGDGVLLLQVTRDTK